MTRTFSLWTPLSAKTAYLRATLPEGYTIPTEGVYVGYSFSLTDVQEADKNPVAVYQGMNKEGLWVHTVRSYFNWESLSAKLGLVSAMQITLDGELPAYGIGLTAAKDVYAQSGEPMALDVQVANHGTQPLDSFTYRYTLPSGEGEGTYRFTEPIQPYFNAVHNVSLTLPVAGERGSSQGAIAITCRVSASILPATVYTSKWREAAPPRSHSKQCNSTLSERSRLLTHEAGCALVSAWIF